MSDSDTTAGGDAARIIRRRMVVARVLTIGSLAAVYAGCHLLHPASAPIAVGLLVWMDLHRSA